VKRAKLLSREGWNVWLVLLNVVAVVALAVAIVLVVSSGGSSGPVGVLKLTASRTTVRAGERYTIRTSVRLPAAANAGEIAVYEVTGRSCAATPRDEGLYVVTGAAIELVPETAIRGDRFDYSNVLTGSTGSHNFCAFLTFATQNNTSSTSQSQTLRVTVKPA
jgi:hypothetical protein